MTKYVSIETTKSGVLLFPTMQFFIPTLVDSNLIIIGAGEGLPLSCVNANQQLIDNINEAIVSSAQGSYTEVVFPVTIPNGVKVLGPDFGGGGGGGDLCQYLITVSPSAPYPIQFTYIDDFGGFNSIEILNDGLEYGPYIAECDSMKINEIATPVDPILVTIEQTQLQEAGPIEPPAERKM
ncbi:MAG: hypothetical protein GY920_11375 [Aliivibrio sp.]|nr:hypothetical protein [Aliivibrio sp.]